MCNFVVSTRSKLNDHQIGTWNSRHQQALEGTSAPSSLSTPPVLLQVANAPACASPVVASAALTDASSSSASSASYYSPSIRSALSSSTWATSLPPVDTPALASKTLPPDTYEWPSNYSGGLTGCFSLHPKDRKSFLYFNEEPHTHASRQCGVHGLSTFLTRQRCGC